MLPIPWEDDLGAQDWLCIGAEVVIVMPELG